MARYKIDYLSETVLVKIIAAGFCAPALSPEIHLKALG
jgi:hypothetical protein